MKENIQGRLLQSRINLFAQIVVSILFFGFLVWLAFISDCSFNVPVENRIETVGVVISARYWGTHKGVKFIYSVGREYYTNFERMDDRVYNYHPNDSLIIICEKNNPSNSIIKSIKK